MYIYCIIILVIILLVFIIKPNKRCHAGDLGCDVNTWGHYAINNRKKRKYTHCRKSKLRQIALEPFRNSFKEGYSNRLQIDDEESCKEAGGSSYGHCTETDRHYCTGPCKDEFSCASNPNLRYNACPVINDQDNYKESREDQLKEDLSRGGGGGGMDATYGPRGGYKYGPDGELCGGFPSGETTPSKSPTEMGPPYHSYSCVDGYCVQQAAATGKYWTKTCDGNCSSDGKGGYTPPTPPPDGPDYPDGEGGGGGGSFCS